MTKVNGDNVLLAVVIVLLSAMWAKAETLPEATPLPHTNGMVRERIIGQGERWEVNGEDVSGRQGKGALAGDDQVPDDSKTPSLTLIGSKEDTSKLRKELMGGESTAPLVAKFLVQEFEPSNPLIARCGFVVGGKPTIYAEMPDGRTLFRLNEYPGADDFVRTVRTALQVAEGVRKPQPDYVPANDPGLALPIKPKIDAEVSPSPATLILSHLAAMVAGAVLALGVVGGGGLVLKKMLSAAVAAEVAKATPAASSATPPTK